MTVCHFHNHVEPIPLCKNQIEEHITCSFHAVEAFLCQFPTVFLQFPVQNTHGNQLKIPLGTNPRFNNPSTTLTSISECSVSMYATSFCLCRGVSYLGMGS
uniref:Phosphonates import ATP-binding protein PhnC 1 n=1 Tax=Lygus hesperus TaxID=30085 RepID=A0A0A9YJG0_LYGHE